VFASSLGSITGLDNRLSLRRAKSVCVVMVDGLGAQNLKSARGHAPFLNASMASSGESIACAFPATTATSLTSFATGTNSGTHGLLGYQVFDRNSKKPLNLLSGWSDEFKPQDWQLAPTVSQVAAEKSVPTYFVGPAEYEGSGFTQAIMPAALYRAGKTIADRVDRAIEILNQAQESLVYLYVPELDQAAHAKGVSSSQWLQRVEELDSQLRRLDKAANKTTGLLVTADHGVIDVPADKQLYLDELDVDWDAVINISGDPRVPYLYLDPDASGQLPMVQSQLRQHLGDAALVLNASELAQSGLYGTVSDAVKPRIPDLAILALKPVAFYHRGHAKPQSLKMIGQHGSLSHQELMIPLIKLGSFKAK